MAVTLADHSAQITRRLLHWLISPAQLAVTMADRLRTARLGPLFALQKAPGGTYQIVAAKGITSVCLWRQDFGFRHYFSQFLLPSPGWTFTLSERMGSLGFGDYLLFSGVATLVGVALGKCWSHKPRNVRFRDGVVIAGFIFSLLILFCVLAVVSKQGLDHFLQRGELSSFASFSFAFFLRGFLPFGIAFAGGMTMPRARTI